MRRAVTAVAAVAAAVLVAAGLTVGDGSETSSTAVLAQARAEQAVCRIELDTATTTGQRDRARWCISDKQRVIDHLQPSPPPSPPPTISPTPAPTRTSLLTGCFARLAACGYPHPQSAGLPANTTLTGTIGSTEIRTAGTVIDRKQVNGFLKILAPGVVIRSSRIVAGDNFWAVGVEGSGSVTIEDTDIDCVGGTGTAVYGSNFTARRVHVHDCENGFHTNSNVTIEESYISGVREVGGGHGDGIQGSSASNVTVRHNTFDLRNPITSSIIWDNLTMTNVVVENNFFTAGAYSVYCPTTPNNVVYRGNRFYSPVGSWQTDTRRPGYGYSTGCGRSGITWSGNYRDGDLGQVEAR